MLIKNQRNFWISYSLDDAVSHSKKGLSNLQQAVAIFPIQYPDSLQRMGRELLKQPLLRCGPWVSREAVPLSLLESST